jgi:hypothetical protein
LDRKRPIFGRGLGEVQRALRAAKDRPAIQQVGARQADTAELAAQDAEREVAVPGDWRKQQRRGKLHRPDPQHVRR